MGLSLDKNYFLVVARKLSVVYDVTTSTTLTFYSNLGSLRMNDGCYVTS